MNFMERLRLAFKILRGTTPEEIHKQAFGRGEESTARGKLIAATKHAQAVTQNTKDYTECLKRATSEIEQQSDRISKSINELVADIRGELDRGRH
jgi:seryl-tRNA synthetase